MEKERLAAGGMRKKLFSTSRRSILTLENGTYGEKTFKD